MHPSQPLLLSSSDDMTIRLWDWEKNWVNAMTFEGHTHYVMMVAFNPKDANTFASASLDRSIKVRPHLTEPGWVWMHCGAERPSRAAGLGTQHASASLHAGGA